jgi:hypothetical protein
MLACGHDAEHEICISKLVENKSSLESTSDDYVATVDFALMLWQKIYVECCDKSRRI